MSGGGELLAVVPNLRRGVRRSKSRIGPAAATMVVSSADIHSSIKVCTIVCFGIDIWMRRRRRAVEPGRGNMWVLSCDRATALKSLKLLAIYRSSSQSLRKPLYLLTLSSSLAPFLFRAPFLLLCCLCSLLELFRGHAIYRCRVKRCSVRVKARRRCP